MMGCLAAAHAPAQDADNVTVDVGECTELESPEERFACYEARVEAELKKRDSPAGAVEPEAPADAAPPAQTTDTRAQTTDGSPAARDEEPPEIVGTVASLRETVPNSYLITLEDGQVWRQTYPKKYPLRVGQRVTLHPTRWGDSLRLTAEGLSGYGYIQVEKVR
jgi:hypothetical protein